MLGKIQIKKINNSLPFIRKENSLNFCETNFIIKVQLVKLYEEVKILNTRQQKLVRFFLANNHQIFKAEQLATAFECSEKTIRTDIDAIIEELEQNEMKIGIDKSNKGIWVDIDPHERGKILYFVRTLEYHGVYSTQKERNFELIEKLLMKSKRYTVPDLAIYLYTNENTIRRQLYELEKEMGDFNLELVTNADGLYVSGKEADIWYFWYYYLFSQYSVQYICKILRKYFSDADIEMMKSLLKSVEENGFFRYTEMARLQLTYMLLFFILRIQLGKYYQVEEDQLALYEQRRDKLETLFKEVEKRHQITLNTEDCAFIGNVLFSANKHFDSGFTDYQLINSSEVESKALKIILLVEKKLQVNLEQDKRLIQGLHFHLDSTIERGKMNMITPNPFAKEIKELYPSLFDILHEIVEKENWFSDYTNRQIDDEVSQLTLHFQAAFERMRKKKRQLKAVIVNNMWSGISILAEAKLASRERPFEVVSIVQEKDLADITDIDFAISIVPLKEVVLPYVVVSPFISEEDEITLNEFLNQYFY